MITNLGCMDNVLPGSHDRDKFKIASELGLSGIEFDLSREDLDARDQGRLHELQRLRDETDVQVPSLCLGFLNEGGLGSEDAEVREAAVESVERSMQWAVELGSKVILIPFFFKASIKGNEAGQFRLANVFRGLCETAENHDLILAYEGDLPASELVPLAIKVNSPAFGCYFDLANAVWLGYDPADEIRRLHVLICQVHMKEARAVAGDARPGEGRVDFSRCAKALESVGYEGWLILETPPGTADEVARDIAFARSIFTELQ